MIHLQNMPAQRGYITKLIGLLASIQALFKEYLFFDGAVPTSNFRQALEARTRGKGSRFALNRRRGVLLKANRAAMDIYNLLTLDRKELFNKKSSLIVYKMAD